MVERDMPLLGQRLKALREAAGLSQNELAARATVSVDLVRHIEQGRKSDPKLSTLAALAEALGSTPGELVGALMAEEPAKGKSKAATKRKKGK